MLHKTLESYYNKEPLPSTDEHPDGPLWPLKVEELAELPPGTVLEDSNGRQVIVGEQFVEDMTNKKGYINYGIRGWRE
jgi:hypothetical protein